MAKENDHIAEELAKIAANFSQAKSEPKIEADPISEKLNAIAAKFAQKSESLPKMPSDEHKTLNAQGIILSRSGKYQEAIALFDKAIKINPNYFDAWHNRGNALFDLEAYEEALNAYEKAIQINGKDADSWYNRGVILALFGESKNALQSFDKAIKFKPDYDEAWSHKGTTLCQLNQIEEALTCFDKAIKINPGAYETWNHRGIALGMLHRLEEAIQSFDQALTLNPNCEQAINNRNLALDKLKETQPKNTRQNKKKDASNSISFPDIIPDYLSREYPDCIRDIVGDNYGFISEAKLLNAWQAIQENGTEKQIRKIASEWANCVQETGFRELKNPQLTKREILDFLNSSILSDLSLIYLENMMVAHHILGQKINSNNSDRWMVSSYRSYQVIRLLMVENLWLTVKQGGKTSQNGSNSNEQTVYTVEWLQEKFESFQAAKDHFGIAARSWQKLAEKLNSKETKPKQKQRDVNQETNVNTSNDHSNLNDEVTQFAYNICAEVYPEKVHIVHHSFQPETSTIHIIFREIRRGWYFELMLEKQNEGFSSSHRVLPSFLSLLEGNETLWVKLTKKATKKDWLALDEIVLNTIVYPGSNIMLAGENVIGEAAADDAMARFGCYIPDPDLLPVFLFENRQLGINLISYFKHPDGFAKENMMSDDNTNDAMIFHSLKEAQEKLDKKLYYYASEA